MYLKHVITEIATLTITITIIIPTITSRDKLQPPKVIGHQLAMKFEGKKSYSQHGVNF